jgi:hypothetical protein
MRTTLVCCLLLNLAVILASGALLQWFPSQQGFTVTTPHATHFISGDIFLSAALLCLVDSALGIYLAWSLLHPRWYAFRACCRLYGHFNSKLPYCR